MTHKNSLVSFSLFIIAHFARITRFSEAALFACTLFLLFEIKIMCFTMFHKWYRVYQDSCQVGRMVNSICQNQPWPDSLPCSWYLMGIHEMVRWTKLFTKMIHGPRLSSQTQANYWLIYPLIPVLTIWIKPAKFLTCQKLCHRSSSNIVSV